MKNKPTLFLSKMIFILCFCPLGCQVYNSSSGDALKYSISPQGVLQKRCSSCHNFSSQTDEQLLSNGLIIKGSLVESPLFSRIRGSGVSGLEDMPPSGSSGGEVSLEELAILSDWIQRLQ